MLEVITASTDRNLTGLDELKDALGIVGSTADRYLTALISRASAWAESFVGSPLTVQTYRECLPGFNNRRLCLSRYPLRAVLRVFDATDTGTANELSATGLEYRVEDAEGGIISRDAQWAWTATMAAPMYYGDSVPLTVEPMPNQERQPFMVEYVAGYTHGGLSTASANYSTVNGSTSTGRTLPEDLEAGVLHKAIHIYEDRDDVRREKLGDIETEYRSAGDTNDGLDTPEAFLAPYRRLV